MLLSAAPVLIGVAVLMVACSESPSTPVAWPKAPPVPLSGTVVRVGSVDDLQRAVRGAHADTTILLGSGRYVLAGAIAISGGDHGAVTNIALRGATGDRAAVIIEGAGIEIGNAQGVQVADLTFRDLRRSAIHVRGEAGATRVHVHNVKFENVHAQAIRATGSPDSDQGGAPDGIVEYCDFEFTQIGDAAEGWNAIALYSGRNWILKYNRFLSIRAGPTARNRYRPAVVIRDRASDTHTHNNFFLDCDRPIAYGMGERADGAPDHRGGSIYNNFIYRRRGLRGDAGVILWASPDTKVYHNTIIQNGTYPRAIEYRYKVTTGLDIRNNLTDGAIAGRDGAHATVTANYIRATLAMFRNPRAGDLRLVPTAAQAIDRAVPLPGWAFDWDGEKRPSGSRPDIGADEFKPSP